MESDRIPFIVGDNPVHLPWRFLRGRRHRWLIGGAGGLFTPQTPTSRLFGLKLSVFDFSTEGKCKIRQRELFCSTAGNKLLFHILIPLANVQKAFLVFFFFFSTRHICHYWGFSYRFIYICIFVPCDLF